MSGEAEELVDDEPANAIEIFSRRSVSHGGPEWTPAQVQPSAQLRLYRAVATETSVLIEDDRRVPVSL
jgi:hypothetical protein